MTAPKEWNGTVKAMIQHHPDKFGKDGDLNPYAIANSKKKKGEKPHYKDEESTLTDSEPEKKEKYKDDDKKEEGHIFVGMSFQEWLVATRKV